MKTPLSVNQARIGLSASPTASAVRVTSEVPIIGLMLGSSKEHLKELTLAPLRVLSHCAGEAVGVTM